MMFSTFAVALLACSVAVSEAATTGLRGQANAASVPTLPNGISCRFCPDDDNYKYPLDDDWTHWHRGLDEKADSQADAERELTSTDKLKATAKVAHYEAHFLQHAASKQAKDEHKRALQAAAVEADKEASMLVDAVNGGDVDAHDRILKEKLLPNDISCRFCPDDDNYKYPLDDDWTHWHRDLKVGEADNSESAPVEAGEKRKMKEVQLPNGISCRFCPDDDNYKYPLDDDWTHWH